jgi:chromosome segregation ATPase
MVSADFQSSEMIAQIQKQREIIRSQAVEISMARQDILSQKLKSKKELDDVKDQLDSSLREISRLKSHNRTHKADKEIKIAEMTATIRTLSARSDTHALLAAARQEIESEKLTAHHLRDDLDAYRGMLEIEQGKSATLRKEIAVIQGTLDTVAVLRTILDVPGVDPATLIEVFSGKIVTFQVCFYCNRTPISISSQ